ncbi:thermonuclease family protein [Algirhabdus cladophorae]|uniref:thermonuclease family protein n=1 Tax=Algirhabdus cladophorae TaxID=3377108 RepID=UPI003B845EB0
MWKTIFRLLFGSDRQKTSSQHVPKTQSKVASFLPKRADKSVASTSKHPTGSTIKGKCHVIDGDTIFISGTRIRLAGIDAPELDQPYGQKAKYEVIKMCKGQVITAKVQHGMSYDRVVAKCYLPNGIDISALLVQRGLALDWAKFSGGIY